MPTRRVFLRNGTLAVVGTAAVPHFLTRAAFGAIETAGRTKRLVVIFQRGAADGLNIVVPHGESQYYAMRPSINIPRKSVIDIDGFFGLHPSLASIQPLWQQRNLAIVHAAGSPDIIARTSMPKTLMRPAHQASSRPRADGLIVHFHIVHRIRRSGPLLWTIPAASWRSKQP